jgi:hypothetical protein
LRCVQQLGSQWTASSAQVSYAAMLIPMQVKNLLP